MLLHITDVSHICPASAQPQWRVGRTDQLWKLRRLEVHSDSDMIQEALKKPRRTHLASYAPWHFELRANGLWTFWRLKEFSHLPLEHAYPRLRNRKFQCPQKHAAECSLAVKCNVVVLPIVKSFLLWTERFHVGSSSQHWFTGVISICNLLTMVCTWRIEVQKSCWRPHKSPEQRQALDPRFPRRAQAEDPSIMSHDVTWSCEARINGYWPSVSGPYNSIEYLTN